jgi:hypothetical protein
MPVGKGRIMLPCFMLFFFTIVTLSVASILEVTQKVRAKKKVHENLIIVMYGLKRLCDRQFVSECNYSTSND